jgi:hypothetical protein
LKDTLKTNESPLYGYNDAVLYVKDLVAVKATLNPEQETGAFAE